MKASIIIPHYNMHHELAACIETLLMQNVNRSDFEIIVVDNGSIQKIEAHISDKIDVLLEYTAIKDPYNCRNLGIKASKRKIIALLDVKCRVDKNWLSQAIENFDQDDDLSIIAGCFVVNFDRNDIYQIYYSLHHLNHERAVSQHSGLLAGNLFVRDDVFDDLGLFPENKRSGGDIIWTQKAREAGYKISFGEKSIVYYPAKTKQEVLHSAIRDGKGAFLTYKDQGKTAGFHLKMILYHLLPDRPYRIHHKIGYQKEKDIYKQRFWNLWWITWRTNLYFLIGYLKGILSP